MRAGRDSPLRAEAIGIDVATRAMGASRLPAVVRLAGALFVFAKGTMSPEAISVGRSVDALVMVLLGGVQTLAGPVVGAAAFTWLQDTLIARDRLLARAAGRGDAGAGDRFPAGHRGRAGGAGGTGWRGTPKAPV
jgi:ABC-type branched-subunit amino acid transport system permease subunit